MTGMFCDMYHTMQAFLCLFETDLDECSVSRLLCPVNTRCVNTPGAYKCECSPGFLERQDDGFCQGNLFCWVALAFPPCRLSTH